LQLGVDRRASAGGGVGLGICHRLAG
jgi:hypothetical protein